MFAQKGFARMANIHFYQAFHNGLYITRHGAHDKYWHSAQISLYSLGDYFWQVRNSSELLCDYCWLLPCLASSGPGGIGQHMCLKLHIIKCVFEHLFWGHLDAPGFCWGLLGPPGISWALLAVYRPPVAHHDPSWCSMGDNSVYTQTPDRPPHGATTGIFLNSHIYSLI